MLFVLQMFHVFILFYAGIDSAKPGRTSRRQIFQTEFLSAIRKVYDYVIIDTPPLGSVIDSAVIADECDGSIIVMESGVISYRFAQDVKGQLEKCNCPILGVILIRLT